MFEKEKIELMDKFFQDIFKIDKRDFDKRSDVIMKYFIEYNEIKNRERN